jgi:glycosyltransferase involved in cell wall biosynthesis
MKLSIVIPVYRVEATLNRCIESVLRQDVDDMEVILVDDGSPDKCPQICDEWAQKDPRVSVIHKLNGGLSDARNAGIDVAHGDFLTFVDSDDYLAPGTYAPLLDIIEDADILEYSIADRLSLKDHSYTDMNEYWLLGHAYQHTYAWNKIYRSALFEQVRFPKGKVFEDVYTLPQLLKQAHKVKTSSMGHYHYCYNPQGITANASGEQLSMLLEAHLTSQMPLDDTYYLYLLNIQIDVWERLKGDIKLPFRKLNPQVFHGLEKLKAEAHNTLGIKKICKITRLIHRFKKPRHW